MIPELGHYALVLALALGIVQSVVPLPVSTAVEPAPAPSSHRPTGSTTGAAA